MSEDGLTHLDSDGRPQMVDVSGKDVSARTATAEGVVRMAAETRRLALGGSSKKGDAITTSILAGIMAAKRTAELIPLCHPLPLSRVNVDITPCEDGLRVAAEVRTSGQTGVEMEALTAVSVACLTLYDMLKAVQKDMEIFSIRLLSKSGGVSGDYSASPAEDSA